MKEHSAHETTVELEEVLLGGSYLEVKVCVREVLVQGGGQDLGCAQDDAADTQQPTLPSKTV